MSGDAFQAVEAIALSAVNEFFAANAILSHYKKVEAKLETDKAVAVSFASVIGFSGDVIKGSVVLVCEGEFLNKSHPYHAMGMPVGDSEVQDWIGEIANQVLGRMKNKLAGSGVKCGMGTPTTVSGKSMKITPPRDGRVLPIHFDGPFGPFACYLLVVVEAGTVIVATEENSASTAAEGASILF